MILSKADKAIYNTFLQVFDYATLKDIKGNSIDFSNTIIIMTSNLGANEKRGIGFGENKNLHKESAVLNFLSPEFRNRLDKILHFNALTEDMIAPVVEKFLLELSNRLLKKNITFTISENAKKYLSDIGFESAMGARSVKRIINDELKKPLSREMLFGRLNAGGKVSIDIDEKGFSYQYEVSDFPTTIESKNFDYDFKTVEEAHAYGRDNPGKVIARATSGVGYVIK